MANTIEYAKLFQTNLDKTMVNQSVTGWMEANAGQVKYNGGKEIKIPKLVMDGLGNYDRTNGFKNGAVTFEYETMQMNYDRGRKFNIDRNDVDETGFVLTAGTIMSEFQRTKVAPEIDAFRLSTLATKAITNTSVEYGYVPAKSTALEKLKNAITNLRDKGFTGGLVCHCSYTFKNEVEKGLAGQFTSMTFTVGGVNTQVTSIDGVPLVPTSSNLMYTKFDLLDGETAGQEAGGFVKATDGLAMNFVLVAQEVPIAVSKTDNFRIFDPSINQLFDGWSIDYRKYHDIWVLDNKVNGIYVNIKDAQPQG
ncbi:hypothetical protein [Clostridium beijerinckii]|uniref:hypothetical protein n=1 Tax=Clostridium beijerinckii TaxID=1520 RepID=UPI00098CC814|nr:hypothetical protein [Clostridium beijerinckii]NRT78123.1 hypothetical protein [Clostridium beijerinckii]OOM44797.1 hypothetical protein CBEIJ_35430 [Clostridium beijerinckii]